MKYSNHNEDSIRNLASSIAFLLVQGYCRAVLAVLDQLQGNAPERARFIRSNRHSESYWTTARANTAV